MFEQVCLVQVQTNQSLGHLVLVQLRLQAQKGFPDLDWHCDRVEVRMLTVEEGSEPEDPETQVFLCERWLRTTDGDIQLRSVKCKCYVHV